MSIGTAMALAAMVLRMLHEAPELIDAVERFWRTVAGNPGVPPHVQAAVQAAFHKIHEGKVG